MPWEWQPRRKDLGVVHAEDGHAVEGQAAHLLEIGALGLALGHVRVAVGGILLEELGDLNVRICNLGRPALLRMLGQKE